MGRLTTRQVAERLGVKPETVYAYVSRGLLTSEPADDGRGSTFDRAEVDALRARGRRPADLVPAIGTSITLIEDDRHYYRGVAADELADRPFELVAEWLWTGRWAPSVRFAAPPSVIDAARAAVATLSPAGGALDGLRIATLAAAAADPLRFDLSAENVCAAGRTLLAAMVGALPGAAGGSLPGGVGGSLTGALWRALSAAPAEVELLNAALVLMIDHDLAASTFAARVAASARAHPYSVVSAALGAMDGPLHGAASGLAHRMLVEVLERGSAAAVVAEHLRAGRRVPGFGHRIYQRVDPRQVALVARLEGIPAAAPALAAARAVEATVARERPLLPNVDLALAVLSVAFGMPAHAGETIFAVARTVGWLAHALEEYAEAPLRMRPSGTYRGLRPPQPLPGTVTGSPPARPWASGCAGAAAGSLS